MTQKLFYNKRLVNFRDIGKGKTVVLLHGYLESLKIWDEFAQKLSESFRVIAVDLPGHGESSHNGDKTTMDYMAEALNAVLERLNIEQATIIGHSMGGYAALAFADLFPGKLQGFSFFHSVAKPDTDEKRANRDKEIEFILQGKKNLIINTNIPKAFASDNAASMYEEIQYAKKIALATPDKGIISALNGMKSRPDRQDVIKKLKVPFLYVIGEKDNYIPLKVAQEQAALNKQTRLLQLKKSGHMGFMEEFDTVLEGTVKFLKSL